ISKVYEEVKKERSLEKEERMEMKNYARLANVFTPLIKLVASEASNTIAYDSLQIHGGTGFMKDFPIERIYRDARITSIYEGTTQLQAIAAIRGVTTGIFLGQIKQYDSEVVGNDELKKVLQEMTAKYEVITKKVTNIDYPDYMDFHTRRLVEMAGNIIMGYLLILDAMRDEEYQNVAEVFIKRAEANNKEKVYYINTTENRDLGIIKQ
ncbi:MAG: hypothetical protein KAI45_10660, partial [Melioribacteraceae bacterium]|nr:hypothetical protein [Melioribacteraceae bacterium]